MKLIRVLFVLAAIPIVSLCVPLGETQNAANGWHTVTDKSSTSTFQLPDEMTEMENLGDYLGHMRTFTGKRILLLRLNYRATTCGMATPLENKPSVERSTIHVHGRNGLLTSSPSPNPGHFLAGICFDNVDGEGRRLELSAVCVDREALNLAKEIFRTVEVHNLVTGTTIRWTGATGSDFRIKRDPARLFGSAEARSTQTLCDFHLSTSC